MSFHMQDDQNDDAIMAEINMTPMVDVMLVLLIIFIITLPVIQQAVKVELPKASSVRNEIKPESIQLTIDAKGQIFWNSTPIDLKTFDGYERRPHKKIRNRKLICVPTNPLSTNMLPKYWRLHAELA